MSLPTPYWTEMIEVPENARIALDAKQDITVLGRDGQIIGVLVNPDRYQALVDGPEYAGPHDQAG